MDENHAEGNNSINEEEQSGELKRKIIPDSEVESLKLKLSELMKLQKPYLDSELNLIKLAELINMTPHQLSYIINTGFNENFFSLLIPTGLKRQRNCL